jgi:acetyl-CoA carboxylase biotin carboxyl carrier protein
MELNEDDVIQIIRYLEESDFNELRLQIGDLRIAVNRSGSISPLPEVDQAITPADPPADYSPPMPAQPPPTPSPAPLVPAPEAQANAGMDVNQSQFVSITSPMLGTFYKAPKPGEPPFVEVGTVVDEDTTVCIIEVMKLFSTIKAEKRGRIARVCVDDGELVEYRQTLFMLTPDID